MDIINYIKSIAGIRECHKMTCDESSEYVKYRVSVGDYDWVLNGTVSINIEKREDPQHPESSRYMVNVYGFINEIINSGVNIGVNNEKRYGHFSLVTEPVAEAKLLISKIIEEYIEFLRKYSGWRNNLILCPSQCYRDTGNRTLYMRWRHDDPWRFSVVKDFDATDGGYWYDIPDAPYFSHDQYEYAQQWFDDWYASNADSIVFEY